MFRIITRPSNKVNRKGETSLIFDISNGKNRFYLSSGITIPPVLWNHAKQTIRKKEGYNSTLLNIQLRRKITEIEDAAEQLLKLQLSITKKNLLLYSNGSGNNTQVQSFYSQYQEFINEKKSSWASSTLQKYKFLISALEEFSKKYNYPVTYQSINNLFYSKFENYFLNDRGIYNNGLGGYIKNLKAFLYWSQKKGYHNSIEFREFTVYKEEPEIFPLTVDEVSLFERENIFHGTKEDVRNLFLFQIYTGLRFSDTQLLKVPHYDKKNKRITNLRSKKTGIPLVIPLIPKAEYIINKYQYLEKDNRLLPKISNQKANNYLKEIASILGLTQDVIYYKKKGREYIPFTGKRCDLISTHDARRTFITYCLSKGMGAHMIMQITGHSNFRTFERYVKINEKDITQQLNFVWK